MISCFICINQIVSCISILTRTNFSFMKKTDERRERERKKRITGKKLSTFSCFLQIFVDIINFVFESNFPFNFFDKIWKNNFARKFKVGSLHSFSLIMLIEISFHVFQSISPTLSNPFRLHFFFYSF